MAALAGGLALAVVGARAARRLGGRSRRATAEGSTVLITGGSRGLALDLGRLVVDRGAHLAICARDAAELARARRMLEARGGDVMAIECDVGDAPSVRRMVTQVTERFGSIDTLIANAGIITVGPAETLAREDFEKAMEVMYWGAVNPVLEVLPQMRERRAGSIAIITSVGGRLSVPHLLAYAGAKFAAVGFSEGLCAGERANGIRVTTVVPGLIRTGSYLRGGFKGRHTSEFTWFALLSSAPLISMGSRRAARQILDALALGAPEVVLGLPAQIAVRVHGLAPATTTRLLTLVNRLLPRPDGIGTESRPGAESGSPVTDSFLTALGRRGARRDGQQLDAGGAPGAAERGE